MRFSVFLENSSKNEWRKYTALSKFKISIFLTQIWSNMAHITINSHQCLKYLLVYMKKMKKIDDAFASSNRQTFRINIKPLATLLLHSEFSLSPSHQLSSLRQKPPTTTTASRYLLWAMMLFIISAQRKKNAAALVLGSYRPSCTTHTDDSLSSVLVLI